MLTVTACIHWDLCVCKFVGVDLKFVGTRSLTRVIHIDIYIYVYLVYF